MKILKKRADLLVVQKKITESRNKAKALIDSGKIFINNTRVFKSSDLFDLNSKIFCNDFNTQWVSRGALKLLHVFDHLNINIENFICLDIGASTGGFTEVLLSKKIKKIYCVDVGTNQLHEKLLKNKKVINLPKTNAKYLSTNTIKEKIDLIVCDVSFISMKKVIPPSLSFLPNKKGIIIALIKPQFETKKNLKKRGIVFDKNIHEKICKDYKNWFLKNCKMKSVKIIDSPIKGIKGNKEFFIFAKNY